MKAGIDDFGAPGLILDAPDALLPAGAWSDARNVQFRDGALEKCRGYEQAMGTLTASTTIVYAAPISDGLLSYWVYGTQRVLYATDGSTHANISHASLTYSAADEVGWTGGAFHGYLVVNDGGGQIPQQWTPGLGNDCASLTAWPAITCQVMRFYKDFIFALRITDGGNYNPRLIRWSDAAPQGALPASWDYTDPTNQAGIVELAQDGDLLVDAAPLRDSFAIYKENSTWLAEYIGGVDVFSFRKAFSETGLLAENCVMPFASRHLILTPDDLVVHDGSGAQSIADKRVRRWLFSRINTARYRRCFVVPDYRNRHAYVCFPETGYDWPNLALVWNWSEDTFHVMELGGPKTFGASGVVASTAGDTTFDTDAPGSFDAIAGPFDEQRYSQFQSRAVLVDALAPRVYQLDSGETFAGTTMGCYALRSSMPLTQDLGFIKRITRIWPRVIGTAGDTLSFWIGVREALDAPVNFSGPYDFVIGTDNWLDVRVSARVIDLRVEYAGANSFRLHGASFEFQPDGLR